MKKFAFAATLALALIASPRPAAAAGGPFGLGIILGSPTGISGKYFFTDRQAIDFAVGWGWAGSSALHIHASYLFHFTVARPKPFDLKLFFGGGIALFIWGDHYKHHWTNEGGRVGMGLRIPLGLAFRIRSIPIDPFVEVAPGIGFFPGVGPIVEGGIGIRYYF